MSEDYEGPVSRHELLFNVEMALRKTGRLWPRRHVPGDHEQFRPFARAIVEHLELCGMVFFRKGDAPPHRTPDFAGGSGRSARAEDDDG